MLLLRRVADQSEANLALLTPWLEYVADQHTSPEPPVRSNRIKDHPSVIIVAAVFTDLVLMQIDSNSAQPKEKIAITARNPTILLQYADHRGVLQLLPWMLL